MISLLYPPCQALNTTGGSHVHEDEVGMEDVINVCQQPLKHTQKLISPVPRCARTVTNRQCICHEQGGMKEGLVCDYIVQCMDKGTRQKTKYFVVGIQHI